MAGDISDRFRRAMEEQYPAKPAAPTVAAEGVPHVVTGFASKIGVCRNHDGTVELVFPGAIVALQMTAKFWAEMLAKVNAAFAAK